MGLLNGVEMNTMLKYRYGNASMLHNYKYLFHLLRSSFFYIIFQQLSEYHFNEIWSMFDFIFLIGLGMQ